MATGRPARRFRSRDWFDDRARMDMVAVYLERWMNSGMTPEELRSGRPIIGIAQSGSDLNPCNRVHLELAHRIKEGVRDAGGVALEFPTHPLFENCRRPTAALDRNLAYLGIVEILHGYPIDAVVLTTGCDKTTPSAVMAASTVDIPAVVFSVYRTFRGGGCAGAFGRRFDQMDGDRRLRDGGPECIHCRGD